MVPGLVFAQKLFDQFTQEREAQELIHTNERCNRKHQSINLSMMARRWDPYLLVRAKVTRLSHNLDVLILLWRYWQGKANYSLRITCLG